MGAELICFPELSISGYTLKHPLRVYGNLRPDGVIERIAQIAQEKALIIIAGLIEIPDEEKPYISQIVAGPKGLLGTYRKTHLSPPEKETYGAGEQINTFSHRDVAFGIQLCYESHFPEISTLMALRGADIIFLPHASPRGEPEEKMQSWLRHLASRAFDNALYVVACNQVGDTKEGFSFPGVVLALDPAGRAITTYCGNQEKMIVVALKGNELEEVRNHRMKYFLPHRRPELYREISSPSD
jgi:N-carbamoylputrescine amidase